MTTYIRNWLSGNTDPVPTQTGVPHIVEPSSPPSDSDTETEKEPDDAPSAFPALTSPQRIDSMPSDLPPPEEGGTEAERMPPPPLPPHARQTQSSTLAPPPTTSKPPTLSPKKRAKVALTPGHSPLDWANLKSSGKDLRGVNTLLRVPPSELKRHNKPGDAWTSINGKVYNITPYLPFHPGGHKELMRAAGRDATKLFANMHSWVNVDFMLDACFVGFLVPEPSS